MGARQVEGACQVSYRAGVDSMVKVGNKAEEYDTFLREAWALPLEPIREEGVPSLLDGGARQMWGFRSVEGNEGPSSCLAGGRGENNLWDKQWSEVRRILYPRNEAHLRECKVCCL